MDDNINTMVRECIQLNMTPEQIRKHYERLGMSVPADIDEHVSLPKRRKYGNVPTEYDGDMYDSGKEARRAQDLDLLVKAGDIAGWSRQVPFMLPGGIRYIADFVVYEHGNKFRVEDVKSEITRNDRVYVNKKKQMKSEWGITVEEV